MFYVFGVRQMQKGKWEKTGGRETISVELTDILKKTVAK
jgi:hypothetical protein